MHTTRTLWMVVASLMVVSVAQAGIIDLPVMYGQGPYNPNFGPGTPPRSNCAFSEIVFADDFISSGTQPIIAVRWWGAPGNSTGHPSSQVDAHISFHYAVGEPPFSYPHPVEGAPIVLHDVVATATPTGDSYLVFPIYEYEAYLPVPFDHAFHATQSPLVGELFVDIGIPDPDMAWWWIPMVESDPIHDWSASSSPGHNGPWVGGEQYNLPFELMTPEPATLALMGLGGVVLVLQRRRRV